MYHFRSSPLAIALKPYLQRILFAALLCLSVMLIHAERTQKDWVQALREQLIGVAAPLGKVVESPAKALEVGGNAWQHFWRTYEANEKLRFDNAQLLQWQSAALRLEAENAALRELLRYQPAMGARYVTAKAIGAGTGSLSQRLHINAGLEQGLRRHLPVINEYGLIGRVLSVAPHHSEVLLITDMRSRIPVELQPSGLRALLVGDHQGLPILKMADVRAEAPLGESIFTSDDGEVLPSGLYVGKVFAAREGTFEVRPAYHDANIDFVRVVDTHAAPSAP